MEPKFDVVEGSRTRGRRVRERMFVMQPPSEALQRIVASFERDDSPEWRAVDRRLREYAHHRATLDAAELFDLVRAEKMKLHAVCGYAHIYEYMERVLGYKPHAARERMRVARSIVQLPETTAALARGDLVYSAVRELTRVATSETETAWLAANKGLAINQIERMVAGHEAGDLPDDPTHPDLRPRVIRLELPPEVYALWRQARTVIASERGEEIRDADFVEVLCRGAIAPGTGVEGPAHQIGYQQCLDCRRATQNGAGRQFDVGPDALERAACDARIIGSLDAPTPERATTTVTPRLREQVFARDHQRCTVPGCRSARNLEIHHIVEQFRGGSNELSNLTLLCTGHHTAIHAGLLTIKREAPYQIECRWVYAPPMPFGLSPEERRAMIQKQVDELMVAQYGLPSGVVRGPDPLCPGRDKRKKKRKSLSPLGGVARNASNDERPSPGVPSGTGSS